MNCPNCGTGTSRMRFQLRTHSIVECSACQLLYNKDYPEPHKLEEMFGADYYLRVQKQAFEYVTSGRQDPSWGIFNAGLRIVEKNVGRGNLLDVGCAFGSFLRLAASRGWNVMGVEVSAYSSQYARETLGFDVYTGDLLHAPLDGRQFDLITFWDVIEHIRDVRGNLVRASELLRPGGFLIITTDNYRGLLSALGNLLYRISFASLKYPLERFYIPYNSCYLTRQKLGEMLAEHGFRECHYLGIDYPIQKLNLSHLERLVLPLLYSVGDLIGKNSQFLIVAKRKS